VFSSVRNRLVLLFFVITAAAIGFVYLYVVPQLSSSLTAEKLRRLQEEAGEPGQALAAVIEDGRSQAELRRLALRLSQRAGARVTVLGVGEGSAGLRPAFVVADSGDERSALAPSYPAATASLTTGASASAVERIGGTRLGETALPLSAAGEPRWVVVLSDTLADVDDNVALIKRQILIAGGIALVAALAAGFFAARAHSRRLRRLETAAERVAMGDFSTPIPVDSHDEVGELAKTLNEMRVRLERLDRARKEFIANASHELRTPIFSLGGFVELLEEEDPEPDPAARAEFVATMRQQVDRLTKLATDLLDLSKLDADALEVKAEPVDLAEIAESVASEFTVALQRHGSVLDIERERGVVAAGDPDRVAQIIRILLDNALTHTPEKTRIYVTAQLQQGEPTLIVRDDGPGIEARNRGQVFERFFTADQVSGSGLGLAIARELARLMSGELALNSRRGRTEFVLTLPVAARARA
jgi:two-component system, OmpR family, sensor kinase